VATREREKRGKLLGHGFVTQTQVVLTDVGKVRPAVSSAATRHF
jgi:hypothetical protein